MPRQADKLNWKQVQGLKEPGLYSDGKGLYLRIDQTGCRRWVYIYLKGGRRREMGLGSAEGQKLAEVRDACDAARAILKAGGDPIDERRKAAAPAADQTFRAVASDLMDDLEKTWRSPRQRPLWEASLQQHAKAIWNTDVAEVDTEMVLTALRPIWSKNPETASRIRSRIERVLDAAKARGLRSGENPARWRGHLALLLSRAKRNKGHHAAMPYGDIPAFMAQVSGKHSISADALRFLIFTAARSGEIRGATWEEIEGDVWRIPAERMKAGREHRVPLSAPALNILEAVAPDIRQGLIFPGLNGPMSDMTLAMAVRKRGVPGATPHGFRSSFRDWAGDCTHYPRELLEEALAHQVGNAVERAYRRGDALAKRRDLMNAWADFCEGKQGQVVAFRA